MKTLYLHIGSHKTGTSSIQQSLYENRELLNKYDYSVFLEKANGNSHKADGFNSWLWDNNGIGLKVRQAKILAERLNEVKYPNVVMSSEHFSWLFDQEEIANLYKELTVYFDVKIIAYIRRQDKLAVSHHQQGSKGVHMKSFQYFKGDCKALPNGRDNYEEYLNYYEKLSKWSNVFGVHNVTVRVFERQHLKGHDVVTDFLHSIGLDKVIFLPINVNESNGFEKTKIGHLINLSSLSRGRVSSLIRKGADNTGMLSPCIEDAKCFYEGYKSSNTKLNQKFNISSDNEYIFDSDFSCYPVERADLWTEESANRAIQNIFNSLATFNDFDVDLLRDSAIALESTHLDLSFKLMSLAKSLKPDGSKINNKLQFYKEKLGKV